LVHVYYTVTSSQNSSANGSLVAGSILCNPFPCYFVEFPPESLANTGKGPKTLNHMIQMFVIVKNHKHLEIEKQILCTDSTPIICYATASNLAPTFKTPVKLLSKIGTQRTARAV